GWKGFDAGRCARPDQQHGAGYVVDDVAAGVAKASRPEVGALAVADHDEKLGAVGYGDDFGFGAPDANQALTWSVQSGRGGVEELVRRGGGEGFEFGARVAVVVAVAE